MKKAATSAFPNHVMPANAFLGHKRETVSRRARRGLAMCFALLILLIPGLVAAQDARLQVIIAPSGVPGAHWRVDDGSWMTTSATTTLTTHRATVTFEDVRGWNTPEPIRIWVFNGLERVTTGTYVPITRYPIGELPSLQAYEGKALRFGVFSRELGSATTFTATVTPPAPLGPVTTDLGTSLGLFSYTPDAADKTPFNVVFTASATGLPDQIQTVTISPIPALPLEQTAFGLKTGLTIPGISDEKPNVTDVTLGTTSSLFNLQAGRNLRKITIMGREVVFDPADTDPVTGLFNRFNYQDSPQANADIKEMEINAVKVVIRGALRLPKTNVTINAMELCFEDAPGTSATLCTTPLNQTTRAADALLCDQDEWGVPTTNRTEASAGVDGERAGNMTLNIASLQPAQAASRLLLSGGRGQDGGNGLDGRDGWGPAEYWPGITTDIGGSWYVPDGEYIVSYHVTCWAPPIPWPVGIFDGGDPNHWPSNGENAYGAGQPGFGGAGGNLTSTLDITGYADLSGNVKGTLSSTYKWGGWGGDPTIAHRVNLTFVYNSVTVHSDVKNTSLNAADWYASAQPWWSAYSAYQRAPDGAFQQAGNPLAFLQPDWMRRALDQAKSDYLYGDLDKAESNLSEYAELVDLLEAQWPPDAEYTADQMELLSLRDEMRSLLNRIQSNLDYFGNPAGWVPMLSFEVTQQAFKQEVEHCLNLMYLSYWVNNTGYTLQRRIGGLKTMWDKLGDEVVGLQAEYEEIRTQIPTLYTRATQIESDIKEQNRLMAELVERKRKEAADSMWDDAIRIGALAGAQLGLRLGAIVFQVCPVGQPVMGAVGGLIDTAGKVDYNGLWDSAQLAFSGGTDIPVSYTQKPFTELLPFLAEAVKKTDPWKGGFEDKDPATETPEEKARRLQMKSLANTGANMANGLKGAVGVLGEFKVPMLDIEGEAAKLLAQSDEYTTITNELLALAEKKMELMREVTAATMAVTMIPNLISRDMLAMDALRREIGRNETAFSPKSIEFINEIERRSRERLLKYHYYMAKAYEYRLLKPYQGQLDLGTVVDNIVAMADVASTCSLTQEQFDSLKEPYLEQISSIAEEIFTQYSSNPPELSVPRTFALTGEQIASLNAGQPITLNLMEMGLIPPTDENVRIVDISVDSLNVHLDGAGPTLFATMDFYVAHSGVSNIMSKGEVYRFRHYNALTENPLVWGATYDHFATQKITPITPSAASNSLLRSLLSGPAASDMMLYSRPGAWADLVITKSVNTQNNVDIVVDSAVLKVTYDFTRRAANQSALKVLVSQDGFMPYFKLGAADLNARRDGRGVFYRSFANSGTVTVEAQRSYGSWSFQKWTDAYGNDISSASAAPAGSLVYSGEITTSAWTDPAITVNLSTHRAIRAQYIYLTAAENVYPADGAKNVTIYATLDWSDVPQATSYDLYLWRAGGPRPSTPTAAGLTVSRYTPPAPLLVESDYLWQVVPRRDQTSLEGSVWAFRTLKPPTRVRDFTLYE